MIDEEVFSSYDIRKKDGAANGYRSKNKKRTNKDKPHAGAGGRSTWRKQTDGFELGKWFVPAAFGTMYMLAEYATFSTANMIAFEKINMPQLELILIGGVISTVGVGVGTALNYVKLKKEVKRNAQ